MADMRLYVCRRNRARRAAAAMKILMFGWEFPPRISGGLGTACAGLVEGLAGCGIQLTLVLPHVTGSSCPLHDDPGEEESLCVHPPNIRLVQAQSLLRPSSPIGPYDTAWHTVYDGDRLPDPVAEVYRYGREAALVAPSECPDIIHIHDWLTIPAGLEATQATGKPLILHVHSLECDRSADGGNAHIHALEQRGLENADRIIAVSHYTKQKIVDAHNIDPDKISVVHNAVSRPSAAYESPCRNNGMKRYVLFLGRITHQKGPMYFLEAARRVLAVAPDTHFIVAGSGDMREEMIARAAALGIGRRVHFTGFLDNDRLDRIYRMSDVYVMPSVSEPFGLSVLEAMGHGVPVIVSRWAGVTEIMPHCLRVDYWDVEDIADKILALLRYAPLRSVLRSESRAALAGVSWDKSAQELIAVYNRMCGT